MGSPMKQGYRWLAAVTAAIALGGYVSQISAAEPQQLKGKTWVVCAADARERAGCAFKGGSGIQAAVDRAANGDTIFIKAGRYTASAYRDVPYKEITVRSFVLIDGKSISLVGEQGTLLDGSVGIPTTAIGIRGAVVTVRNLEIAGFRYDVEEDDTYEGHGIFVIDGKVRVENVTIRKFQKMGLTGRGDTQLDVTNFQVLDGHVAIWLHETAYLRLKNAVIRGNDSAGIAAYETSAAHVFNSVFEGNLDDGLYTENQAVLFVTGAKIMRNKPVGVRATGESQIWLGDTALFDNELNLATKDEAEVRLGAGVTHRDPAKDVAQGQ